MALQKSIKITCQFFDCTGTSLEEPKSQDDILILKNVYGDPRRFIQIIQNFMSNALKFTDRGGDIFIRVSLLEE